MNGIDRGYASPALRDGFLLAFDRRDGVALTRLARNMTNCGNPLPSAICTQMDIPLGSTYGFAARRIVVRGMNGAIGPGATPLPPVDDVPSVAT
jgi:hypothetical protein